MNNVFVRLAQAKDGETFASWVLQTPGNAFDPGVMQYPSTTTRVAYDRTGPLVFQIIQRPLHMDSIAVRPGAEPHQVAMALRALLQDVVASAHAEGRGEIFFLGSEATVPTIVQNQKLFEELPYRVYRLKVKDLEKANDPGSTPSVA